MILTLDSLWEPHHWVTIQDAVVYEYKGLVQSRLGEIIYTYRGGTNRFTGEQSSISTNSIIVLNSQPSTKRYKDPILTNKSLFARDRYTCGYCGKLFKDLELTRDHIVPVSKGGLDKWNNVITSCKPCNNLKDDMMLGDKIPNKLSVTGHSTFEILYKTYVPCKAEIMIIKNKKIKPDQLEYLLSRIKNKQSRILNDNYDT